MSYLIISFKNLLVFFKTIKLFSKQIEKMPYGDDKKYSSLYHYLLQASLFSEIGISTSELLEYLKLSRPTLQKKLNNIGKHNLLITERRGSKKYYQLSLEELVKTIEKIIAENNV